MSEKIYPWSPLFIEFLSRIEKRICLGEWGIDEYKGLYNCRTGKVACSIPVLPYRLKINADDDDKEYVELIYIKYHKICTYTTERKMIASGKRLEELASHGIEVSEENEKLLCQAFNEIITRSQPHMPSQAPVMPVVRTRDRLGWDGEEFIPYSQKVEYNKTENFSRLAEHFHEKGSFKDWIEYTRRLRKNKVFRIMLAASFAGPLVDVIGQNSFITHLWGKTGKGKTVTLMAAMSVWGNPDTGALVLSLNNTENALGKIAGFLHNVPVAADELQTIKNPAEGYDELIMQITEGKERERMNYNYIIKPGTWRTSFLFTGEEPCVDTTSGGGAKNRVIQINSTEDIITNGNETANFYRANYGFAGRRFIEKLDWQKAKDTYKSVFDSIMDYCDTTEKQAGSAALLLTADWLSSEIFWELDENGEVNRDEEVLQVDDIRPYLMSDKEVDIAGNAFSAVCDLISAHNRNFTADALERWGTIEDDRVYFNIRVLSREMKAMNLDYNAVKADWAERGYLIKAKDGRYRTNKTIAGITTGCALLVLGAVK